MVKTPTSARFRLRPAWWGSGSTLALFRGISLDQGSQFIAFQGLDHHFRVGSLPFLVDRALAVFLKEKRMHKVKAMKFSFFKKTNKLLLFLRASTLNFGKRTKIILKKDNKDFKKQPFRFWPQHSDWLQWARSVCAPCPALFRLWSGAGPNLQGGSASSSHSPDDVFGAEGRARILQFFFGFISN